MVLVVKLSVQVVLNGYKLNLDRKDPTVRVWVLHAFHGKNASQKSAGVA